MRFSMLYKMIYALAAKDGREEILFGDSAPAAGVAFERSLACDTFPELWFELPLTGEPWFDLHALTSREDVFPDMTFAEDCTGGNPAVFQWFSEQERGVRQLALSWDIGRGDVDRPAVQLLVNSSDIQVTCGFLEAAGRPDAVQAFRAFAASLPAGWFACYAGVFPGRPGHNLRVECIPDEDLQRAYASDSTLLEAHLIQMGMAKLGDTLVPRCQLMAKLPLQLEFQFDVDSQGCASETFAASVRFAQPPGKSSLQAFDPDGAAGDLMRQVEAWGLADNRWRLLADTVFAKRASLGFESSILYCYPAFLKFRWRAGNPLDAKAYLIAGAL